MGSLAVGDIVRCINNYRRELRMDIGDLGVVTTAPREASPSGSIVLGVTFFRTGWTGNSLWVTRFEKVGADG